MEKKHLDKSKMVTISLDARKSISNFVFKQLIICLKRDLVPAYVPQRTLQHCNTLLRELLLTPSLLLILDF